MLTKHSRKSHLVLTHMKEGGKVRPYVRNGHLVSGYVRGARRMPTFSRSGCVARTPHIRGKYKIKDSHLRVDVATDYSNFMKENG